MIVAVWFHSHYYLPVRKYTYRARCCLTTGLRGCLPGEAVFSRDHILQTFHKVLTLNGGEHLYRCWSFIEEPCAVHEYWSGHKVA